MSLITIGIPCYDGVKANVLEDYMRLAYYLGRRMPQHEFLLAIKSKSEQFRARNAIMEAALQANSDYLLFLDDDQVIDWDNKPGPNSRYGFLQTLVDHMESDPKIGIIGVVYYHRGAQCRPVLMKEGNDGGYYWLRDDEVHGMLQEVGVQGGGCMLLRMSAFGFIQPPYFEPEFQLGTDIQISKKVREAGYKVMCDTSIQIGHLMDRREVVTPNNRHRIALDNAQMVAQGDEGLRKDWLLQSALTLYRLDAEEYAGMSFSKMAAIAERYHAKDIEEHKDDIKGYYATRGVQQLARQVLFHHTENMVQQADTFLNMFSTRSLGRGIDIGCGSAPVSFELALRGHAIDFIDIDGASGYEFTKWRVKRRNLGERCGFSWNGPYDFAVMFDSLEHIADWKEVLNKIRDNLRPGGALITNYFLNGDYENPEHISMDKVAVQKHLVEIGLYPLNHLIWVNQDLGFMDRKEKIEEAVSVK